MLLQRTQFSQCFIPSTAFNCSLQSKFFMLTIILSNYSSVQWPTCIVWIIRPHKNKLLNIPARPCKTPWPHLKKKKFPCLDISYTFTAQIFQLMYRFEKMFKEGFYSCWQSKNNSSNIYLDYTVLSCLKTFTENVIKELNLFDETIENIKNTQTLCFIVIVSISWFLISYLACQQSIEV